VIQGLFDNGAMPVLERMAQFTQERHRALTHNIANLSTPYFKPVDLDTDSFQLALRDAVDERRGRIGQDGPLPLNDTRQLTFGPDWMRSRPQRTNQGVLFHDENNRDLERIMQDLAENSIAHNMAIEMIRNQFAMLRTAIRERL